MENERARAAGCPCHTCNANGGPAGMPDTVICLRPKDSGMILCKAPLRGCENWVQATPANLVRPPPAR